MTAREEIGTATADLKRRHDEALRRIARWRAVPGMARHVAEAEAAAALMRRRIEALAEIAEGDEATIDRIEREREWGNADRDSLNFADDFAAAARKTER